MRDIRGGITRAGLSGLLVLALAAPRPGVAAPEPAIAAPITSNVIVAVGDRNYPPYLFLSQDKPAGFDLDLLQAACDAIGLQARVRLFGWSDARRELEEGRADVIPGMAVTAERETTYSFTVPTAMLAFDLFVRDGSHIRTLGDARATTVAVQQDGVMQGFLERELPGTVLLKMPDPAEVLRMISRGEAQCGILNKSQALFLKRKLGIANVHPANLDPLRRPYAFAVMRDNQELKAALNEGLRILKESGRYDELYAKWFGPLPSADVNGRTLRIAAMLAGMLAALLAGASIWTWALRRQVRARTADLARELAERHRTEAALRKTEEQLSKVFVASPDGIIITRMRDGMIIDANPGFQELVGGVSREEAVNHSTPELGIWANPEHRTRYLALVAEKGECRGFETTLRTRTCGMRDAIVSGRIMDFDGEPCVISIVKDITDRKAAERALRRSKEFAETLVSSLKDGIILLDSQGVILTANEGLCRITGFSAGELVGQPMPHPYWPPEEADGIRAAWERVMAGRFDDYELMLQRKDGQRFPALLSPSPMEGGEDSAPQYIVTLKDVTTRRRAEDALRQSEERFRQFAEAIDQVFWFASLDPERLVYVSPACLRIYGFPPESFLRDPDLRLSCVHPADEERVREAYRAWTEGNRNDFVLEYRILRADGQVRWVLDQGAAVRDETGRPFRVSGIVRDITDKHRFEEALAFTTERLAMVARATASVVGSEPLAKMARELAEVTRLAFQVDACVIRVAEGDELRLLATAGLEPDVLAPTLPLNWGIGGQIGEEHRPLSVADAESREVPQPTPPGIRRPYDFVSYVGAPLLAQNQVVGILGIYTETVRRDFSPTDLEHLQIVANHIAAAVVNDRLYREITAHRDRLEGEIAERQRAEEERLRLEARILQAQKMESLGVLAGGIAHDFNNLLVGILGNAGLALEDLPGLSPARETLSEIEVAARRAAELCRQMLAYSGKGRFVIETASLNELVREMAHLLEVSISKKISVSYHFDPRLPLVNADTTQLRQVVMNLITNAAEAVGDQSGTVTVETGCMECGRDFLSESYLDEDLPGGEYVYLRVTDTGCGMDAETVNRIFDPFFTTKFTGRGLGLAAVLGIIRGHRGAIRLDTAPGRGTSFMVLLPAIVEPSDMPLPAPAPAEDRKWRGKGTILVVDDEPSVRSVMDRVLRRSGFEVILAEDGAGAVEFFRANPDGFRCVLLDLMMPRMDGEETLRELRAIRADMPVVLTSGYSEQEIAARFAGQGLAGFVQKPFLAANLISQLRRILGEENDTVA